MDVSPDQPARGRPTKPEMQDTVVRLRMEGLNGTPMSFAAIAAHLGVTRQRVHEIWTRAQRPEVWDQKRKKRRAWEIKRGLRKFRAEEGSDARPDA